MNVQLVTSRFEEIYAGGVPSGVCQAPGRVNLIGEHIDYSGLAVLPMAIDRYVWAAFRPRTDNSIHLASDDAAYAPTVFDLSDAIQPAPPGDWSNYARAAVQALNHALDLNAAHGMDVFIASDLPAASGLSSSTALVVATAMAYLSCAGRPLEDEADRKRMAEILAEGEQYVGTKSGGMDQAAILLGQANAALKIDFDPLRYETISMPDECAVVVCHSGVNANKGGDAQSDYNRGPAMCGLIRELVEHHAQQEFGDEIEFATLGEIWSGPLCLTHSEAAELFEGALTKDHYSLAEVAATLGADESALRERWPNLPATTGDELPLRAWSRHQYQELRRVEKTRDALLCNDLAGAGQLMLESHASCSEALCVSTRELDALVKTAMANGAYGARLTGAGFGGCTVNLVPKNLVATFIDAVWSQYYEAGPGSNRGFSAPEHAIFEVAPANGAAYR